MKHKVNFLDLIYDAISEQRGVINLHSKFLSELIKTLNLEDKFMYNVMNSKDKKGLYVSLLPRFSTEKPENSKRLGRLDIPGVEGYLEIILKINISKKVLFWTVKWNKTISVYWEV